MKAKTNKGVARKNTGVAKRNTGMAQGQHNDPYYHIDNKHGDSMLMTTLAVGAAGVLGYFGWEYYKKKKGTGSAYTPNSSANYLPSADTGHKSKSNSSDTTKHTTKKKIFKPLPAHDNSGSSYSESDSTGHSNSSEGETSSDFPLKKGSKGSKVQKMQQALISKYGSSILPKYGADGDFGSETAKALKKEGLPAIINESAYNVIVGGGSGSTSGNTATIAEGLHNAAQSDNFNTALNLLKKIDSKEGYEQVNTAFEDYRLGGVRQTLVNGMMNTFTNDDQKQKIRYEFLRMGLQYDGNKWSLSGFDGLSVVTKIPTTVWINATETVKVPAKMVLGNQVGKRLDFTLFENNGKYFLVKTAAVKHL